MCRGSILQEILPAMKLVKYYTWEKFFEDKISKIRKRESKLALANIWYKTFNICLVFTIPPLCAFVIFTTYEFSEARLKATVAFTTLTLFNILRFPLVVLPKALRAASGMDAQLVTLHLATCSQAGQRSSACHVHVHLQHDLP
jgi:ATP-binding cassette, subfamily C (CFTR/MRP), member 1